MKRKYLESDLIEVVMKLYIFNKDYIADCSSNKSFISSKLCPRCGKVHLPGDAVMASASKISPIEMTFYICSECALPDKLSKSEEDFLDWAIVADWFNV